MRPNLSKYLVRLEYKCPSASSAALPINSVIQVEIDGKTVPCNTVTYQNRSMVEATSNGKRYLCEFFNGKWVLVKNIRK